MRVQCRAIVCACLRRRAAERRICQPLSNKRDNPVPNRHEARNLRGALAVSKVASGQAIQPGNNFCLGAIVLQPCQPIAEDVSACFGDAAANFDHCFECNLYITPWQDLKFALLFRNRSDRPFGVN